MKIRRDRFRRTFTEANDRHGTFRNGKKTIRRHLAEHVTNLRLRSRAQHAVRRQIGRMKIVQILRFRSSQHFDDLPEPTFWFTSCTQRLMARAISVTSTVSNVFPQFAHPPTHVPSSRTAAPRPHRNTWSYTRADNPWYGNNRSWR